MKSLKKNPKTKWYCVCVNTGSWSDSLLHLHQISSLRLPHAEHRAQFPLPLAFGHATQTIICNAMWLLLVTAEKGCRKVTRLSCNSKTYSGVCHRHSLFTNKKTSSELLRLLEILKQKLLMFTHDTTEYKTIKSELNQNTSRYSWPWVKLIHVWFSLVIILDTNNCWMCPCKKKKKEKTNSFSPSAEEMTTLLTWVCFQTIKITGQNVGQHWENFWNYVY